jgi:hypothetical protein
MIITLGAAISGAFVPGGAFAVPAESAVQTAAGPPRGHPPDALPATFDGQAIFGWPQALQTWRFQPLPANCDAFLGLPPGTTQAAGHQPGFAVSGALAGSSSQAVLGAVARLESYTGVVAPLGRANGLQSPGNFEFWSGCYWLPTDLVWVGEVTRLSASWFYQPFLLVIRRIT